MERTAPTAPPTADTPDLRPGETVAAAGQADGAAAEAGAKANAADGRQPASAGAPPSGTSRVSRCPSTMRHAPYEMALASGQGPNTLNEILTAAFAIALGRRR